MSSEGITTCLGRFLLTPAAGGMLLRFSRMVSKKALLASSATSTSLSAPSPSSEELYSAASGKFLSLDYRILYISEKGRRQFQYGLFLLFAHVLLVDVEPHFQGL